MRPPSTYTELYAVLIAKIKYIDTYDNRIKLCVCLSVSLFLIMHGHIFQRISTTLACSIHTAQGWSFAVLFTRQK